VFTLSPVQITELAQGRLGGFTAEHRHYRDDDGNGILHLLITHGQPLKCIQDAISRLTVNPHTFNKQWLDPICLALQSLCYGLY